jgi:flagellar motility protein MotE (MotC chaperone)
MCNPIIKSYQKQISESTTQEEKLAIASRLHEYVRTLSAEEREEYKTSTKASIRSKTEVMDKLIAAYEAMKEDALNFA